MQAQDILALARSATGHARDMAGRDVERMMALTPYPQLLSALVYKGRETLGFFPAHNPRALEYPWILAHVPADLQGVKILDVGAGVNPLPLVLADRGAVVTTVDNHPQTRVPENRAQWNEWGFLDYATLDPRITSMHCAYEQAQFPAPWDCIYSVSVIEHLQCSVRQQWIEGFAVQLKPGGLLLLTVDLIPGTDLLWNRSEGQVVEETAVHGSWLSLLQELENIGLEIQTTEFARNIPDSQVDVGLLSARHRARG